eukprot:1193919-Prorocentrum_minimum.AAC.2
MWPPFITFTVVSWTDKSLEEAAKRGAKLEKQEASVKSKAAKLDVGHYDACSWCDACAPLKQVWEGAPPPEDQSDILEGKGPHCKLCVGCTVILRCAPGYVKRCVPTSESHLSSFPGTGTVGFSDNRSRAERGGYELQAKYINTFIH